jgi:von Willebrand factor type A domain/Aerotolerance regulator N-terminal
MGFLDPRNLLWGLSLAVLVIIYLRSRARPLIEVSSLMLFDEQPAPAASVRRVHFDPLFWLEVAALAALTLAIAGFFVRIPVTPARGRSRALVFDVGAAMGATDGGLSRLDRAKAAALEMISSAAPGDEFSVISYALEAQLVQAPSSDDKELRSAINGLRSFAVTARPVALRAALMRARGAADIALFSDRTPPQGAISNLASAGRFEFHRISGSDANLAIVSLDPGAPGSQYARISVRNFSAHPAICNLAVDMSGTEVMRRTLMLAPREQATDRFLRVGPLNTGGLVRARILDADALAADNTRYALAAAADQTSAIIFSPDAAVRDDLARTLLAVNPNFRIETIDAAKYQVDVGHASNPYALAIFHDSFVPQVPAKASLLIFPPLGAATAALAPGLEVQATASAAELRDAASSNGDGVAMGDTRALRLGEWMEPSAFAILSGHGRAPAVAFGQAAQGAVGVVAFDVRDHMLLDPDHLDALVATIDLVKRLVAPTDIQIVATGNYVSIPAASPARVTAPDGTVRTIAPDKWGRVTLRPVDAGRYTVQVGNTTTQVLANYYDATESDLAAADSAGTSSSSERASEPSAAPRQNQLQPLVLMLAALALIALVTESALLARHSARWGMRHV